MERSYKAKICGTTNLEDVRLAADENADFFGAVIEVDFSPRSLSIDDAVPLFSNPPIPGVALVFNMEKKQLFTLLQTLKPFAVQFLNLADISLVKEIKNSYSSLELWQSIHLPQSGRQVDVDQFKEVVDNYVKADIDALIFDTAAISKGKMKFGGTGLTSDWEIVKSLMKTIHIPIPVWLAGGINPVNVGRALDTIDPYGIDLCSGVEAAPGKKDPLKVKSLMSVIKEKSINRREFH